ncbi:MAG: hypothetical protein WBF52_00555, partial [Geitlerinemataceae cyanobacterium]
SLSLTNNSSLDAGNFGVGNAGNISVSVNETVTVQNSKIFSDAFSENGLGGSAGSVEIVAPNGMEIAASTIGSNSNNTDPNAQGLGNITLSSDRGSINLNTVTATTANSGVGFAGDIVINARDEVAISDSDFSSNGELGQILIGNDELIPNIVRIQNSRLTTLNEKEGGMAGFITVNAGDRITISENSEIRSDAYNADNPGTGGIAGVIEIKAPNGIEILNSTITSESDNSEANAELGGFIELQSDRGSINLNQATLSATNFGSGAAGFITLNAGDRITISENSGLFSDAYNDRLGEGGIAGSIQITAPNGLEISDSIITSESDNELDSDIVGNIIIKASSGSIDLNRVVGSTTNFGVGIAGDILIDARDEVTIFESVLTSDGELGQLLIGSELIPNSIEVQGSQLTTQTENEGGQAGLLSLVANPTVIILDSQLSSNALNNQNITLGGSAGAIEIIVPDGIEISDTTISSDSANNLDLDVVGNIILRASEGDVDLNDTTLSTTNFGSGTAGDIEVAAEDVYLKDSFLEANSRGGDGGFIEVNVRDFVQLRDRSRITTNAGTAQKPGNGGGITVDSEFLIGVENSDLTANAFEGNGGIIEINTEGILGLQFRDELTPSNDITAFSEQNPELSGVVEINSAAVDTAGLVTLAESPVDVTALVGEDLCSQNEGSEFVITGRGGLPPNPGDVLSNEPEVLEWTTREGEFASEPTDKVAPLSALSSVRSHSPSSFIEATGWVMDENGTVILVAEAPRVTPSSPAFIQPGCHRQIEVDVQN